MRVLFFGTSPFAVPTLDALHAAAPRHTILAVVTQPDRPSGRGNRLQMPPIKERALEFGYEILQPERVRRKPFPEQVREIAPDVLVVISFGQIIPQSILDVPRFGGINVHASLLPRWRGAAPIHHAIIAGDAETGVATMRMEATLDTGPVLLEAREPIRADDTVATLEPRLAALGGPLLVRTLDALEDGSLTLEDARPQSEDGITYAAPVTREMGFLDPLTEGAEALAHRIRGVSPRPGAFISVAGKTLKVLEARSEPPIEEAAAGTVAAVRKDGLVVSTTAGTLLLSRVQPESRGPMSAADFARGARLQAGDVVTKPAEPSPPSPLSHAVGEGEQASG